MAGEESEVAVTETGDENQRKCSRSQMSRKVQQMWYNSHSDLDAACIVIQRFQ